jgi:hypothetical protein
MADEPKLDDAEAIADWRPVRSGSASEGIRLLERIARVFGAPGRQHVEPQSASLFLWGPLEIKRVLGAGSFGEVFAAWDPTLHREVALKLRSPETGALRWLDEARHLARIRHPNVLTVYGADVRDGRAGIWTELLTGRALEEELQASGPLAEKEVLRVGRDIASALAAVHGAGLVHGDVKPANIVLEDGNAPRRAVLVDFGSADRAADEGETPAYLVGTPLTMAPEVLSGASAGPAADVYGLGATLFRLLSGRYPVEADSLDGLRAVHARGERLGLREVAPAVSARLARVIERALEKDPSRRWGGAEAFRRALDAVADPTRRIRTRAAGITAGVAVLAAGIAVMVIATRPGPGPISRSRLSPARMPDVLAEVWRRAAHGERNNWGYMAAVADLDGDGRDEVVVGEPRWPGDGATVRGRVMVFPGTPDGPAQEAADTMGGDTEGYYFGDYLANAGDVDADGCDDLLVLERTCVPNGGPNRVRLYPGSRSGLQPMAVWAFTGQTRESALGATMTSAGDVNGDGYGDALVGENMASDSLIAEGHVYLFMGSATGLDSAPAWVARGGQTDAQLGYYMYPAGDINRDGFDDVLLGATMWDGASVDCGQVRLYPGGARGPARDPLWTIEGAHANANLGICVAGAGDVNGDGFGDIIVGERRYSDDSRPDRGRALLYLGGPNGPAGKAVWEARGPVAYAHFGVNVAGVGDVDGDGLDDVGVAGDRYSAQGRTQAGLVEIYRGTRDGCEATPAWRAIGEAAGAHFGHDVWAGDFDGDDRPDLLICAPLWGDSHPERGLLVAYRSRL